MSKDQILNFIHIYLIPDEEIIFRDGKETYDDKGTFYINCICVTRLCFVRNYLKTDADNNYWWLNKTNRSNLHFPSFFLL